MNNGPLGTDVGVLPTYAARELKCRAIRAVRVDDDGPCYPARILEVYGPGGKPPLAVERTIAAANDGGRWVFETSGTPFAFEDEAAYTRTRKSSRFHRRDASRLPGGLGGAGRLRTNLEYGCTGAEVAQADIALALEIPRTGQVAVSQ
jgi:hypothetical protein